MTYRGQIKNGVVVLDSSNRLAEGTFVLVEPLPKWPGKVKPRPNGKLGKRLMKFAGTAKGLPKDMARNHDYYIHGTPRK